MSQIIIEQNLGVHQMMNILEQYKEEGIKVMVTDEMGVGEQIGTLKDMVTMNSSIKGSVAFIPGKNVKKFKGRVTKGFIFTSFYGKWVLTQPWSQINAC